MKRKAASQRTPASAKRRDSGVGAEVLAGLKQALAHQRGETVPGLAVRKPVDVAAIRKKTGLSQDKFAQTFGLAATTVRAWEQKQRAPDLAAQTLLRVIETAPEAVKRAVKGA
jgi:putative transcriptional regulator